MRDKFHAHNMIIYIKNEIAKNFSFNLLNKEFK